MMHFREFGSDFVGQKGVVLLGETSLLLESSQAMTIKHHAL